VSIDLSLAVYIIGSHSGFEKREGVKKMSRNEYFKIQEFPVDHLKIVTDFLGAEVINIIVSKALVNRVKDILLRKKEQHLEFNKRLSRLLNKTIEKKFSRNKQIAKHLEKGSREYIFGLTSSNRDCILKILCPEYKDSGILFFQQEEMTAGLKNLLAIFISFPYYWFNKFMQVALSSAQLKDEKLVAKILAHPKTSAKTINESADDINAPLLWAVLEQKKQIIKLLLKDSRTDVNVKTAAGDTALILLLNMQLNGTLIDSAVIKEFLDHPEIQFITNNLGTGPLDLAEDYERKMIISRISKKSTLAKSIFNDIKNPDNKTCLANPAKPLTTI
jgi:hypothetical protein